MAAIYRRERIEGKGWRYVRVNLGRGRRPAAAPPYYVRFTINGKRKWSDPYDTLKDAQEAAETLPDVIEAQSKNMTLGELAESRNMNRIAVKSAVDTYLTQKASKAPKTRLQYTRTLSEFLEALATCKVRFLDEISEAVLRKYKTFLENQKVCGQDDRHAV